jgi:iron complex transport system substrate-binding protein
MAAAEGSVARAIRLAALVCFGLSASMPAATVPPSRIVSLVPSVTEMLFAIGAGSRVVAVSSYDHYPPEVERLPRVGALVDPDVEKILSLRPDLVVMYGTQGELVSQMQRAGIAVLPYRHGSLADILGTMRALGKQLGLETGAGNAVIALTRELNAVRARVQGRPRPRTLLVIGREPRSLRGVRVSGGYGFLHDLVQLAGGANVFSDVKRESIDVTTETILARAPEVIVELHYSDPWPPDAIRRERDTWFALPAVPAVRQNRVVLLFGGELVVPGPRVGRTALAFARAIHPDLAHR